MLYRVEIENFFSIRDLQVLDLTVAPNVPDPDNRFAPIFIGSDLRAPKVVAIYGANASGKTNVLKAIAFIAAFVRNSNAVDFGGMQVERFNDLESMNRPVKLAIELGGIMNLDEDVWTAASKDESAVEYGCLRYEVEIEIVDGVFTRVLREALRQRPNGKNKWQRVFERERDGNVYGSASFKMSKFQHLITTLRPKSSVLANFAHFNHPTAALYVQRVQGVLDNLAGHFHAANDHLIVGYLAANPAILHRVNRELSRVDVGVEEFKIVDVGQGPQAMFRHSGLHAEMPWALESQGTLAFIRLFPMLANVLDMGSIALVDEFDTLMHPLLLPEVLRWFYDYATRNPYDAQVWLSCHSATLLEDLAKEEVVITTKSATGRTSLYSLMDVKSVRRDENLYRKYLGGAYGGVPHVG